MSDDCIIPFAKMKGMTSFASLSIVKRILSTKKVGHTGTLDSFADGLLVLVTGKMTHLASFIEAKNKVYDAVICFGKETNTLDTEGSIVNEQPLPFYSDVRRALKKFTGDIMQVPPSYSALHVEGKRASDITRSGREVVLAPRKVCINEINIEGVRFQGEDVFISLQDMNELCNKKINFLHIRVACSKGTYIRALARDIGKTCNSCAYLVALRRLSVGAFSLENAFGFELLPDFGVEKTLKHSFTDYNKNNIDDYKLSFTKKLCSDLGFVYLDIKSDFKKSFVCGKDIKESWFFDFDEKKDELKNGVIFVFDFDFLLGVIEEVVHDRVRYKYRCVLKND